MSRKAVVAGHICVDITPEIPGEKVTSVSQVLAPGKLLEAGNITISTGGAVANTGLAMKILGIDVTLMGKTGQDDFAEIIRRVAAGYGCGDGLIASDEAGTSYSIILAIPGIDRIFLHNAGVNDLFYAHDVDMQKVQEADLFHFGYPTIMRSMYENEGAEFIRLFSEVAKTGVLTSLDLAMVQENSEAGRADWETILSKALPHTDFFLPSIEELLMLLDRKKYHEILARCGEKDITEVISLEEDVKPLAEKCIKMGAGCVLIKCGAPGLYYKTAGASFAKRLSERLSKDCTDWAEQEGFETSYVPDKVRSGTGAGDTTIGAFLAAMLQGYPLKECLKLAVATGASCVETYDVLSGLRSFPELEKRIHSGWKKNS